MAQRTVALCDGKYIGIETIYTVIDGKQINIYTKGIIASYTHREVRCAKG